MVIFITSVFLLIALHEFQVTAQALCPTTQSVVVGQKGVIKCSFPNIQGQRIWKISSDSDRTAKDLDPNEFQIEPGEIIMDKVNLDYNENYELQLEILNPTTKVPFHKSVIRIEVKALPKVKAFQKTVDVGNNPVTIGCEAVGKPTPTIKWFYKLANKEIPANEATSKYTSTSYIQITEEVGLYQCIASNEVGSSLENIVVNSENVKIDPSTTISKLEVTMVTDSSVSFQIEANANGKAVTHIYFLYTLYSWNSRMKEDHSGTLDTQDGSLTISGLPKGSAVIFHFAAAVDEAVGLASTEGFTVYLLPPTPQIAIKSVTDEYVQFEWRTPFSARFATLNAIDFYELKYGELSQKGDDLLPATCLTEIKISSCIGNSYKMYRRASSMTYSQIEIRAHSTEGYSDWSSFLVSPKT